MKTSKLKNFAWVFFALALTSSTVLAQGWRRGNTVQNRADQPCLTQISDLSEVQASDINELDAAHRDQMAELRNQRRSTSDPIEKSEIRTTMLKNVEAHRNAVKSLLSEEQKIQYEQLLATAGNGIARNSGQRKGNGNLNGRGQGNRNTLQKNGRGNGKGNRGNQQPRRGGCMNYTN